MPDFDAIVVGSGMTGGWAAKELAEAGLKVAVLERGQRVTHRDDYRDFEAPWELPHLNRVPEEEARRHYAVQSRCYAFQAANRDFWVRDSDYPYVTPDDRPFLWFQGCHLGGRSEHDRDVLRGWAYQGRVWRESWPRALEQPGVGADFKHSLRRPGPWVVGIGAFGEMLPAAHNRVTLHETRTDRYGIPAPYIDVHFGENEQKIMRHGADDAVAMLKTAGCVDVRRNYDEASPGDAPGVAIHEMGTARMGEDPRESVLNRWNQAHDVPNLFVSDGACMTSSANQNPSLTYMALTARAANHAAALVKDGTI